jgi:S-adenosylmethionine hydrolase
MTTQTDNTATLQNALARIKELEHEIDALNQRVTPCTFHGRDVTACITYSGQAPCDADNQGG